MTNEELRAAVAALRVEIIRRGHVEWQLREWLLILRGRLLHTDPSASTDDVDAVLLPAERGINWRRNGVRVECKVRGCGPGRELKCYRQDVAPTTIGEK